ncbi:MAG: CvpA family protein [Pelagibacteraceae bacterium]
MIENFFENLLNNLNLFDLIFIFIIIFNTIQCFIKGFSLSIISFLKWILALIITIICVPKFQPWLAEYVKSDFLNSIGLGLFIFIFSLFVIILIGKSFGKAVTWTGMGSIDKYFGLIFGIFKGYIVSVCLFTILNWFYPYQNWGISAEEAKSFKVVKKGSEILIDEFPDNEDLIDTKEKIEKI